MNENLKRQLIQENTDAVYATVLAHQTNSTTASPHPKLMGMPIPSAISFDLVASAVKFAVDQAQAHFGGTLEALAQTQKGLVDQFVSDAALEAIAGAVRRLEQHPAA